uniref:Uncharacterized protein n=1 Tax=Sphaerodactylus townsendi TaxID=933632 RepID=A0ACB8G6P5_9SAUR
MPRKISQNPGRKLYLPLYAAGFFSSSLRLAAQREGLLDKLPAHRALLEIHHAFVAQAGVAAREQHPVDRLVLADDAVLAAFLCWCRLFLSQPGLLEQGAVLGGLSGRGVAQ